MISPTSPLPAGDKLYIANVQSSNVPVLSVDSLEQIGAVRVGAMPYGVAVAPGGERVLIANQQSGTVNVIDAGSLARAALTPLRGEPLTDALEHLLGTQFLFAKISLKF